MTTRATMTLIAIAHMRALYSRACGRVPTKSVLLCSLPQPKRFTQAGHMTHRLNVSKRTSRLYQSSGLRARHRGSRQRELAHGLMRKCQLLFDQLHRHVKNLH